MYEPIALQQYEKFMFNRKTPVAVLKSGFVVSKVVLCLVHRQMPKFFTLDVHFALG